MRAAHRQRSPGTLGNTSSPVSAPNDTPRVSGQYSPLVYTSGSSSGDVREGARGHIFGSPSLHSHVAQKQRKATACFSRIGLLFCDGLEDARSLQ